MGGDRPLDLTLNCMCMYMHLHMCMLQVSFYNIERVGFLGIRTHKTWLHN